MRLNPTQIGANQCPQSVTVKLEPRVGVPGKCCGVVGTRGGVLELLGPA